MKDPGPYPVELLKAILEAPGVAGAGAAAVYPQLPMIFPAIFHDNCEGTRPYTVTGTGTGWEARYENAAAYVGLNGLDVETKDATPASSDFCRADLLMPANILPIIRFQCLLARKPATSTNFKTNIMLTADDATTLYLAQIQFDWQTPSIAYLKKSNGTWDITVIGTWQPNYQDKGWNHVQLAINVLTGCYHEIIMNGLRLSIPTELLSPGITQSYAPYLKLRLETWAVANAQASTIYDQILVTAEEAP